MANTELAVFTTHFIFICVYTDDLILKYQVSVNRVHCESVCVWGGGFSTHLKMVSASATSTRRVESKCSRKCELACYDRLEMTKCIAQCNDL